MRNAETWNRHLVDLDDVDDDADLALRHATSHAPWTGTGEDAEG
jgi:hypothetical protein